MLSSLEINHNLMINVFKPVKSPEEISAKEQEISKQIDKDLAKILEPLDQAIESIENKRDSLKNPSTLADQSTVQTFEYFVNSLKKLRKELADSAKKQLQDGQSVASIQNSGIGKIIDNTKNLVRQVTEFRPAKSMTSQQVARQQQKIVEEYEANSKFRTTSNLINTAVKTVAKAALGALAVTAVVATFSIPFLGAAALHATVAGGLLTHSIWSRDKTLNKKGIDKQITDVKQQAARYLNNPSL